MNSLTRFQPLKIVLNAFENGLSLFLPKVFNGPFFRHFIRLTQIARLASRNNVVGRIAAIARQWNVVLLMQHGINVEQRRRISAVGTTSMPVIETSFPVGIGKCGWKLPLTGESSLYVYPPLFGIVSSVLPMAFQYLVSIGRSISLLNSLSSIGMFLAPLPTVCIVSLSNVISVVFPPLAILFLKMRFVFLKITIDVLPFSIWILLSPFARTNSRSIGVIFSPDSMSFPFTKSTARMQSSDTFFGTEEFGSGNKPLLALRATFIGNWLVNHLKFSLCDLVICRVDRLTRQAVHSVHEAELVHLHHYNMAMAL